MQDVEKKLRDGVVPKSALIFKSSVNRNTVHICISIQDEKDMKENDIIFKALKESDKLIISVLTSSDSIDQIEYIPL